jgi:sulfur carrier protein
MVTLQINGQSRTLELEPAATLGDVLEHLGIKPDRVAVERNGDIAGRQTWSTTSVADGDRLEIVHFVGGGCFRGSV